MLADLYCLNLKMERQRNQSLQLYYDQYKFALKLAWLLTVSNLFSVEFVQNCQLLYYGKTRMRNYGSAMENDFDFDFIFFSGGYWYNDCYISNLNGPYCKSDENNAKCMSWWRKEGRLVLKEFTLMIKELP